MNRKAGRLSVRWSRSESDWLHSYPRRPDGHLTHGLFSGYINMPEFLRELQARGYDLTTLRLVVDAKAKS